VELLPHVVAVISVIVGTGGIAIVVCVGLWLLFCRWVIKGAVKRGGKPYPIEVIRAASLGMIGRSSKAPLLAGESSSEPNKKAG
jgi:hypothetical protein